MRALGCLLVTPLLLGACETVLTSAEGSGGGGSGDVDGDGHGGDEGDDGWGDSFDGCEQAIDIEMTVVALPPDILLVVDRSSSMGVPSAPGTGVSKWEVMGYALGELLDDFETRAKFGLLRRRRRPGTPTPAVAADQRKEEVPAT